MKVYISNDDQWWLAESKSNARIPYLDEEELEAAGNANLGDRMLLLADTRGAVVLSLCRRLLACTTIQYLYKKAQVTKKLYKKKYMYNRDMIIKENVSIKSTNINN